eukprot:SAG11_NODE_25008_length_364_cov_5.649057_1_plen_68_part_10
MLSTSSPRGRTASSSRLRPLWRSGSPTAGDAPAAGMAPAAAAASLRPSRLPSRLCRATTIATARDHTI